LLKWWKDILEKWSLIIFQDVMENAASLNLIPIEDE